MRTCFTLRIDCIFRTEINLISELYDIILASIKFLENYKPKVVVVASMTPSIQVLQKVRTKVNSQIIGVMPPLRGAARLSKKKHIGIMATQGTIFSHELAALLRKEVAQDVPSNQVQCFTNNRADRKWHLHL